MQISFEKIVNLTGHRIGRFDVACPVCGPERQSPKNQTRKVLRIWRFEENFASYRCSRCGAGEEGGWARKGRDTTPDPVALAEVRAEAAERETASRAERISTARWLWSTRVPMAGTIGEPYLRNARRYGGTIPATMGFLPARGSHGPAMIAAFGLATEPEPGRLAIAADAVTGVHLTRLAPDGIGPEGNGKAGSDRDKIMVGACRGSPIILAPVNDLLGLAVTEGIEDALSTIEATGLGGWAAGSAAQMPALAEVIPAYCELATIMVDADADGRRHAARLAELVAARGIGVRRVMLAQRRAAA
jgi:hypothetical protein